jgi:(p)ppGpp synthase/HD superfamily hydrolase
MSYDPDRYVAALRFAADRHHGQRVPGSGHPYVVHVVTVAAELIAALPVAAVGDPDLAVTCALLHDTIEDAGTRHDELVASFGRAVADGVAALSKDPTLPKEARMADSLRRIQAQPAEVWMVKLADRIANLAPPPADWPSAKRRAYRDEAIVIADALGAASAALAARLRAKIAAYGAYLDAP